MFKTRLRSADCFLEGAGEVDIASNKLLHLSIYVNKDSPPVECLLECWWLENSKEDDGEKKSAWPDDPNYKAPTLKHQDTSWPDVRKAAEERKRWEREQKLAEEREHQRRLQLEQDRRWQLQQAQEQAQAQARLQQQQQLLFQELRKIGNCPAGYMWVKVYGGYRCTGGHHFVTDAQVQHVFQS